MMFESCLSGHLYIRKDGRAVHLSPDDIRDLHNFLHRRDVSLNICEDIPSHNQRCDNNCSRKGCYFHPNMGTKSKGLDIDHPITIGEFIRRFGCAKYID
jgi:hypothetical protein